ncbi:MAG: LysM peptidoglycan-binding domain-containing protein [Gemmatimonadota bacterium]
MNQCRKNTTPRMEWAGILAVSAALGGCASGGGAQPGLTPGAQDARATGAGANSSAEDNVPSRSESFAIAAPDVQRAGHPTPLPAARPIPSLRPHPTNVGDLAQREVVWMLGPDPYVRASTASPPPPLAVLPDSNALVDRWIDYFQTRQPARFRTYLERAGRYEGMIRGKLRESGLPEDLLYLALIESGMNPYAYSRASAVGLWQFIRGTGRRYGLEISYWVDERRDPFKATDAAIAYLADLHDRFGSWYLAAAAYNAGEGRVSRGIRRTGSTSFWRLADARVLRRETRNYVPKMIAAATIARNLDKYGFYGVEPEPPLDFEVVEVPDATSFDVLAKAAGVQEEEIKALNPQFLRGATPPKRTVQLRVPQGHATAFASNYAEIPPSERVTWLEHVVTRGQTLSHIAVRHGTSVRAIRAANGNVNPRRLRVGQRLVIPRSGMARTSVASAATSTRTSRTEPRTITVRRGDSLWTLARRHNVSTSELIAMNNLTTSRIYPGDRLTVRR